MYKNISKCRICGSPELTSIFNLGDQYLTGVFPKSRDENISIGPVEMVRCSMISGCGLVQLRQSYNHEEMYGLNYGYRSGLNNSMVKHLRSKVDSILRMGLLEEGDVVIDIGSNDATTLLAYPQDKYQLIGVDPTGVKFAEYYPKGIKLIADFFSEKAIASALIEKRAKVITSFSMFYDLEDPVKFAREVALTLHDDGVWIFEQSYLPSMLETNSFDTICHEHLEFYALKQIMWILKAAGLKALDVEFNDVNGGSFSVVAAKQTSLRKSKNEHIKKILDAELEMKLDTDEPYRLFKVRVEEARHSLLGFLSEAKSSCKTVYGLGASTKGNVLLQYFGIDATMISGIGEVNKDKFGAFTPGTYIPLMPESEVLSKNPDYILILPWHFKSFFENLPEMKGRTLLFPLPSLQVITL